MRYIIGFFLFVFGLWLLGFTFFSVVRTFVVPRNEKVLLTRIVFGGIRIVFDIILALSKNFSTWDKVMALYAPISLLAFSITGIGLIFSSYWIMFMGMGIPWKTACALSGSFLLTLGSASTQNVYLNFLGYSESVIGLIMVAMLVSFLPTIYTAFSKREVLVARLEFRAGSPPSGVEIIARLYRLGELHILDQLWSVWENWFVEVEESHTSLFALAFFRSPKPQRSWVNASGAILDATCLITSTVEREPNYQTDICFQAGVAALCSIADFFDQPLTCGSGNTKSISISHEQYKLACLKLSNQGVPLKRDTLKAWADFKKARSQYDGALLSLAALTVAPEATWASYAPNNRVHALLGKIPFLKGRVTPHREKTIETVD
jgi:hypothetical protein